MRALSVTVAVSEEGSGLLAVQGRILQWIDATERHDQVENAVRAAEQLVRETFVRTWEREDNGLVYFI